MAGSKRIPASTCTQILPIELNRNRPAQSTARASFDILHEDDEIIVLNKPAGLLSIPSSPEAGSFRRHRAAARSRVPAVQARTQVICRDAAPARSRYIRIARRRALEGRARGRARDVQAPSLRAALPRARAGHPESARPARSKRAFRQATAMAAASSLTMRTRASNPRPITRARTLERGGAAGAAPAYRTTAPDPAAPRKDRTPADRRTCLLRRSPPSPRLRRGTAATHSAADATCCTPGRSSFRIRSPATDRGRGAAALRLRARR